LKYVKKKKLTAGHT